MERKDYIVMENHRKLWRYVRMESRKYWFMLFIQVVNVSFLFRTALFVDDIPGRVQIIGPLFCWAGGMCSYTLAFCRRKAIFDIVSKLQLHYDKHKDNPKDRAIILACYGEGNRMLRNFGIAIIFCGASFMTKPFSDYALQYYTNGEAELELPFPAVYPWEVKGLVFWVTFALHLSVIPWVMTMVVVNVGNTVFFCMAVVSQLQLAQERFMEIPEECSDEEGMSHLKVALRSHQEALGTIKALETVESVKVFSQVFTTAAALSMCIFMLSCIDEAGGFTAVMPFALLGPCVLVHVGLVCFYGQKIINEGDNLYNAIYAVPWCNHSERFKSLITFCLMRAARSDRLTACSFADISMETFNGVMTTAFSYVTFLQTMSE